MQEVPRTRSLDSYPSFLFNNYDFKWRIIVGDNAPKSDLETANALIDGMDQIFPGYLPRRELIKKASDVGDHKNLILVGRSPFYAGSEQGNPLLDTETPYQSPRPGQGLIEFRNYDEGHFRLIVTGYDETDVINSGKVLSHPIKYHLSGKKVIVKDKPLGGLEIEVLQ